MFVSFAVVFYIHSAVSVAGHVEPCEVLPKDPVIRLGSDIQITIRSPENSPCRHFFHPSKLFWTLNNKRIPEEMHTEINSSMAAVTVRNFTLQRGTIECLTVNNIVLGGTTVKAFALPAKPVNLSCVLLFGESLTCYWDNGDESLDTTYEVTMKQPSRTEYCNATSSPCKFGYVIANVTISVVAKNPIGEVVSDALSVDPLSVLKIQPPVNVRVKPRSSMIQVRWEMAEKLKVMDHFQLTCEVRTYYYKGNARVERVDATTMDRPDIVAHLDIAAKEQCTNYTVRVRCAVKDLIWSEWSNEATVFSPLHENTAKVHLWRTIGAPGRNGTRRVLLFWKGIPLYCHALNGYRLLTRNKAGHINTTLLKADETKTILVLGQDVYNVTVVAFSEEKTVAVDSVIVPAVGTGLAPVMDLQTVSENNQINVSWRAPRPADRYIVHWCIGDEECSWRDSRNTNLAFEGQSYKLYRITVTPYYNTSLGLESTVLAYVKQGEPGIVSSVQSDQKDTSARITWMEVAVTECCGFVVNYTVFYKPEGGAESSVTVNSGVHEVWLQKLKPNTKYGVHIMASSIGGSSNSSEAFFRTNKYDPNFIVKLGVITGICVILFLIACFCCALLVKKYVLMTVPDPQLSTLAFWPGILCKTNESFTKLWIPPLDFCFDKLDVLLYPCDSVVDELNPKPVNGPNPAESFSTSDKCEEPGGNISTDRSLLLPAASVCPDAGAIRAFPGYVAECTDVMSCAPNKPCVKTCAANMDYVDENLKSLRVEQRPLVQAQRRPPQSYVTIDMFETTTS